MNNLTPTTQNTPEPFPRLPMECQKLLGFIRHGKENAISRDSLVQCMGLPDRHVRQLIETARRCGYIIINAQDGKGYYLSDDPDEWAKQYRQDTSRALSILSRRKAIRDRLKAAGKDV